MFARRTALEWWVLKRPESSGMDTCPPRFCGMHEDPSNVTMHHPFLRQLLVYQRVCGHRAGHVSAVRSPARGTSRRCVCHLFSISTPVVHVLQLSERAVKPQLCQATIWTLYHQLAGGGDCWGTLVPSRDELGVEAWQSWASSGWLSPASVRQCAAALHHTSAELWAQVWALAPAELITLQERWTALMRDATHHHREVLELWQQMLKRGRGGGTGLSAHGDSFYGAAFLQLSAFLERLLGDVFFALSGPVPVPKMLKDLLSSAVVKEICGEQLLLTLHVFVCIPMGLNLRNLLWHGYLTPRAFNGHLRCHLLLLLLLFVTVCFRARRYLLGAGSSRFTATQKDVQTRRPLQRGPRYYPCDQALLLFLRSQRVVTAATAGACCHHVSLAALLQELQDLPSIVSLAHAVTGRSSFVVAGREAEMCDAVRAWQQHDWVACLAILLPTLEYCLRASFVCANGCATGMLTAESTVLYTTLDSIVSTTVEHGGTNRLWHDAWCGKALMEALTDLYVRRDGVRLRDRVAHAEVGAHLGLSPTEKAAPGIDGADAALLCGHAIGLSLALCERFNSAPGVTTTPRTLALLCHFYEQYIPLFGPQATIIRTYAEATTTLDRLSASKSDGRQTFTEAESRGVRFPCSLNKKLQTRDLWELNSALERTHHQLATLLGIGEDRQRSVVLRTKSTDTWPSDDRLVHLIRLCQCGHALCEAWKGMWRRLDERVRSMSASTRQRNMHYTVQLIRPSVISAVRCSLTLVTVVIAGVRATPKVRMYVPNKQLRRVEMWLDKASSSLVKGVWKDALTNLHGLSTCVDTLVRS